MLTHQFPLERYPSNEGWTVVETGGTGGEVTQLSTSLSGRGTKCVRIDSSSASKVAYFYRTIPIAAGEWFAASLYFRRNDAATYNYFFSVETYNITFTVTASNYRYGWRNDSGADTFITGPAGDTGAVHHIAFAVKRASAAGVADGEIRWAFDGVEITPRTGILNYNSLNNKSFRVGYWQTAGTMIMDVDEIRFGTRLEDVLPSKTTPPVADGELPQASRTIVLFNQNNADSRAFGESIATDESLLCPLPCSASETLADYATFFNEVEHPVKNFLTFQPAVAVQSTCIIAGHYVPGYFYNGSSLLTVCSRLSDIDNAFSANKTNPFYGTSSRLNATLLRTAKMRLTARIDAATLSDCYNLKALGDIAAEISEGKKIFTSDAPSLDQYLLRLPIKILTSGDVVSGDSIYFISHTVSGTSIADESADGRLACIFNNASDITRDEISSSLSAWNYRCLILYSSLFAFDFAAFCRMLRADGTIAECFMVACAKVNAKNQLAAWPMLTAIFPKAGYNVYLGEGSVSNVDYSSIQAALPISTEDFEVNIPHKPNSIRAMCIRKISSDGLEETRGRVLLLESDSSGLIHLQLPVPYDLTVRGAGENKVELSFSCIVREGQESPVEFEILGDNGTGQIDLITPIDIVPFKDGEREYASVFDVVSRPAIFTVRARCETFIGAESSQVCVMPLRIPVKPEVLI